MIYRYDGSFAGFLSAVYEAYHDGTGRTEGIRADDGTGGLFSEEIFVPSDSGRAERVASAFYRDCGAAAAQWLYRAFLAEERDRESVLFIYIRKGFRLKKDLYARRAEPWAWTVFQWARKIGAEAEKMRGLVRFRELKDGLLYAEIHPSHDVLPLIANHFRQRFSREEWAIHDVKRRRAVYWDGKELVAAEVTARVSAPAESAEERGWQQSWRAYYRHIAIETRRNPALRRSFMPQKYWRDLTELAEAAPANGADGRAKVIRNLK